MGEDNGLSGRRRLVSGFAVIAGENGRVRLSAGGGEGGMSLISAATILTPFYRSSLSRADFVRARNTAHTATSPVAMKNYPPFVEKERHQSPPGWWKGTRIIAPLPSTYVFFTSSRVSNRDFRIFSLPLDSNCSKLIISLLKLFFDCARDIVIY